MRFSTCRWAVCFGLVLSTSVARAAEPTIPFTKYRLKNGLTVLLSEDHRLPLVAVNVWYSASPANEPPKRSGFAHLFEHMMFQGSKHVGDNDHIKLLEQNGVTLFNGTTDFDRTNYFETLPASRLELGLWLESDRMGFLADAMTKDKLDNQREVVRNERRQSIENTPYGPSDEELVQALYPPDHPYHGNVIGSHEDLEAATLDDVKGFHKNFYSPANAVLTLAGDFKPEVAKRMIEKYFGPLGGGPRQPRRQAAVPVPKAERRVKREAVSLPRIAVGWVTPPAFAPGDADLDLATLVLGEGRSSRLFKRLVYEQQIASNVSCMNQSLALGSMFQCSATVAPGKSAAEVERALQAELDGFRAKPVAAAEVERARNTLLAMRVRQLEQLGGFGGKSDVLQYYEHYKGDPGYLPKDLARYLAVTPATLLDAAQQHLADAHRVTVVTLPLAEKGARP